MSMLINVIRPDTWDELNDDVCQALALGSKIKARVFQGLGQAVFEIAQGTAQFMAHKKAIGVIQGQTPVFDPLLPYYYKETYVVQALPYLKLENVQEWVSQLAKETCFVLFAEDHPVTGEIYPFVEELDKALNEKRIYSFRVSYARHFFKTEDIRPYTVRLCSFQPDLAVAVLGERFRSPSLMSSTLNWDKEHALKGLETGRQGRQENPLLVEKFEKEMNSAVYFKPDALRLQDRSVMIFPDVNAEALAQSLFKKCGWNSEQGWRHLATTNMCHWSGLKMFKHWWLPTPSPELLRGLLVADLEAIATKDFAKLVTSSYEELKQLQSWDV